MSLFKKYVTSKVWNDPELYLNEFEVANKLFRSFSILTPWVHTNGKFYVEPENLITPIRTCLDDYKDVMVNYYAEKHNTSVSSAKSSYGSDLTEAFEYARFRIVSPNSSADAGDNDQDIFSPLRATPLSFTADDLEDSFKAAYMKHTRICEKQN